MKRTVGLCQTFNVQVRNKHRLQSLFYRAVKDLPFSTMEFTDSRKRPASDEDHGHYRRNLKSLHKSVSPPPLRRGKMTIQNMPASDTLDRHEILDTPDTPIGVIDLTASDDEPEKVTEQAKEQALGSGGMSAVIAPLTLTSISGLPEAANRGSTTLHSLIGDPLVRELWVFNFLIDLDFVMSALDFDIRHAVKVYIVHGSWKRESEQRIRLEEQRKKWANVDVRLAYMPEPFGTHHSKMFVVGRADDTAEVVIHTANMIAFDWTNMTQGVWRSGPLPLLPGNECSEGNCTGCKFKTDLTNYFSAYGARTKELTTLLSKHDFSGVKAIFVGSVPSKVSNKRWGWPRLKDVLSKVKASEQSEGHVVVQVSSIASLPKGWLSRTFLPSLVSHSGLPRPNPRLSIVFPRIPEIRRSLNGYRSGGAVHTKVSTASQKNQVDMLRTHLCGWTSSLDRMQDETITTGGRSLAAPHIKTYVRFSNTPKEGTPNALLGKAEDYKEVDWLLLTSANLSTQAWGAATNASEEVRICSWEAGVLIHPGLWGEDYVMRAYYADEVPLPMENVVYVRIPYDTPLRRYAENELPWSPGGTYRELDVHGQTWES